MEEMNYQYGNAPQGNYVEVKVLFKTIWERRKVLYWVLPITLVLSSALILCVPKYYACDVVLAPEQSSANASGSLQALASSFGLNMQNMSNVDALYPTIYPDVVESPDFMVRLFHVPVRTAENDFEGTYYQYMLKKHKRVFWMRWKSNISKWLKPAEPEVKMGATSGGKSKAVNVFYLSKSQWYVLDQMQRNISCKVDKKTDVISFRVKAQDKLVCAIMADSVCAALQEFVTDYRTKKARVDLVYYEEVMEGARDEYELASEEYIKYADSHSGMNLEQYRIEAKNLETEMLIKQAAYTSFQKQYLATQARLQENTPVYTVIKSASIPTQSAGPKRMLFVLAMLFLATCITSFELCKDQLLGNVNIHL